LETQIRDHKAQLQARLDSLAKINDRGGAIDEEVATLQKQRQGLEGQIAMITQLILQVRDIGPSPDLAAAVAAAKTEPDLGSLKTQTLAAVHADSDATVRLSPKDTQPDFQSTQRINLNANS
jgi:hypothetical protein